MLQPKLQSVIDQTLEIPLLVISQNTVGINPGEWDVYNILTKQNRTPSGHKAQVLIPCYIAKDVRSLKCYS